MCVVKIEDGKQGLSGCKLEGWSYPFVGRGALRSILFRPIAHWNQVFRCTWSLKILPQFLKTLKVGGEHKGRIGSQD